MAINENNKSDQRRKGLKFTFLIIFLFNGTFISVIDKKPEKSKKKITQ